MERTTKPYYDRLPTHSAADTAAMTEALHADGFALMPGVLSPGHVSLARDRIDELEPQDWDWTGPTDHDKNVFNRSPFWVPYLDLPGVIELAEATLGRDCHVIGQTAWRSHPGHRGVGLHLDYLPMEWPEPGVPDGFRVPMFLCTAHVYLSPQPLELCPTHIIPGSHKAGRKPKRFEDQSDWRGRPLQPVLCEAGDVLYFRSDLWHSGSDNVTTDQTRYLLQVHYGRREMAQHFAPYLAWRFDPTTLDACTDRQLRLLGDHRQGAYD
jgi:Phytanoyl-CoA dioxygenase (PhyH)